MRVLSASSFVVVALSVAAVSAQSQSASSQSVPRLINIAGVFRPADGQPAGPVATVTLSIYADQQGGAPLWQETQTIALDAQGRYSLLLGATRPDGIPAEVFGGEAAHWLGTVFERAGEVEGPRTRLTSVPYALRAAEAETLGGRPASDYQLAPSAGGAASAQAATAAEPGASNDVVLAGTPNFLAKYVNAADVGNSGAFEAADGSIGLGTTTPFDRLHVRYNNGTGDFTGLAVQNTNGGALAYSGMLFYDHTNALTQFQGYNNSTHEYRINNIAKNGGGAFNGSINFMIGGISRFFVSSIGNIGIGTTAPSAFLDVSNALFPSSPSSTITVSTFSDIQFGSNLIGRKARGTAAAPAAVLNNDALLDLGANGYGTTAFGNFNAAGISMRASENWTDAAHGTLMQFSTTSNGATAPSLRMTINSLGNVGIGTASGASLLEVSNGFSSQPFTQLTGTTYAASGQGSLFVGRKARGTSAAPTSVQNGDVLGGILGRGYGGVATGFNGTGSGSVIVRAAETWTDVAQGTLLNFNTTSTGTAVPVTRMTLTSSGNLGLGTNVPGEAVEIARDGNSVVSIAAFGTDVASGVALRTARGTQAAPTVVQAGDALGYFVTGGWDGLGFADAEAGMIGYAAENWTSTTRGAGLGFFTTPIGLPEDPSDLPRMVILPSGEVGIGTGVDGNGLPAVADKLQVVGDVRVGTSGTNGCVKNFAGTGIIGTCSSDRRLKKNITPFAPMLDKVTALQPVHYFWRSDAFPDRHFGNSQNYGLIAQDVEQVLPELVATDSDGYKAVDYSKLPLLTIQAVKELKAENDGLKQRVADLERLVIELLAAARR